MPADNTDRITLELKELRTYFETEHQAIQDFHDRTFKAEHRGDNFGLWWWEHHGSTAYPLTGNLAKMMLAIPATSVSSERAFQHANFRSSDGP